MSPKKYLLLKGVAGLGNRIEAYLGAWVCAQLTGRTLMVDWRDGLYSRKGDNAFYKFFKAFGATEVLDQAELQGKTMAPLTWSGHLGLSVYDHPLYGAVEGKTAGELARLRRLLSISLSQAPSLSEDVLIYYAYHFEHDLGFLKTNRLVPQSARNIEEAICDLREQSLSLSDEIVGAAQSFQQSHFRPGSTIGVHVRNTDNQRDILYQTDVSKHRTLLQSVAKKMKNAQLFLATDSQEIVENYKKTFSNLSTIDKVFPADPGQSLHHSKLENKEQSARDTLLELSLLGRVDLLIFLQNRVSPARLCACRRDGDPSERST